MVLTSPPARPTSRPQAYRRPRRRRFWVRRAVLALVLLLVVSTAWSVAGALRAPGDDTPTKLAEWARDHGLGVVVTAAETVQYKLNPPATGGTAAGPLVQVTYVRPDAVHTSYLTGLAWMSHRMRFVLHPGYEDPGTAGMSQNDLVTRAHYSGLTVTFNGGFKLKDAVTPRSAPGAPTCR